MIFNELVTINVTIKKNHFLKDNDQQKSPVIGCSNNTS